MRRVACTRLIDLNRHWIVSTFRSLDAVLAQAIGDCANSLPAVLPARAVTMPYPASAFCSCFRGSVLCMPHVSHLHVLMRLIARVLSWRCYPRTVSFLLLNTVVWRCYPRSPSQPSSSPPWPCMSSRSWHLALGARCLLSCSRLLPSQSLGGLRSARDVQPS